jgi:hypothetical protein
MNKIELKGKEFTVFELEKLIDLVNELLNINETLNAQQIALVAKLSNEEIKVKGLQQKLFFITQAFTGNTYEA